MKKKTTSSQIWLFIVVIGLINLILSTPDLLYAEKSNDHRLTQESKGLFSHSPEIKSSQEPLTPSPKSSTLSKQLLALGLGGFFSASPNIAEQSKEKDFAQYYFEKSTLTDYLPNPEMGNMMAAEFFGAKKISDFYGMREKHPVTGEQGVFHQGEDLVGTAPRTPVDGIVRYVSTEKDPKPPLRGYGNAVVIYNPELKKSVLFGHLDEISGEAPSQGVK